MSLISLQYLGCYIQVSPEWHLNHTIQHCICFHIGYLNPWCYFQFWVWVFQAKHSSLVMISIYIFRSWHFFEYICMATYPCHWHRGQLFKHSHDLILCVNLYFVIIVTFTTNCCYTMHLDSHYFNWRYKFVQFKHGGAHKINYTGFLNQLWN